MLFDRSAHIKLECYCTLFFEYKDATDLALVGSIFFD